MYIIYTVCTKIFLPPGLECTRLCCAGVRDYAATDTSGHRHPVLQVRYLAKNPEKKFTPTFYVLERAG